MPLRRWTGVIAAAGFSLAVLGNFPPAQAAEKAPAIEPRAGSILKAALEHLAAAKSFTFEAEVVREVPLDSGQRVQRISTLKTFVRRPDRMAAIRQGSGGREGNLYYDGKVFTLWNQEENVYAQWDAPATLDALFDTMQDKLGFVPPLSVLLREDAGAGNVKNVLSGIYVGRTDLRGVECHHLAFVSQNVDWQVWVAEGVPVIKRVVVTYKKAPTMPQYTATFLDWDFNARLGDYLFAFEPPPGASRIEFQKTAKP